MTHKFKLLQPTEENNWALVCFCYHNIGHMASRQSEQDMMRSLMSLYFLNSCIYSVLCESRLQWPLDKNGTNHFGRIRHAQKGQSLELKSFWMCLSTLPCLVAILSKLMWQTIGQLATRGTLSSCCLDHFYEACCMFMHFINLSRNTAGWAKLGKHKV